MFDDVRLPEEVEQGSTGGPSFFTSVLRLASGAEARNQNWQQQKMLYDVGYGVSKRDAADDPSNFYAVLQFFYARRGRLRGFRFKDWTDYQALDELTAATDTTHFQLQKTYSGFIRKITRPVVGTLALTHDDGTVIDPAGYTLDASKGVVTFTAAQTGNVHASFEFDVPVRFDTDVFTMTIDLWNAAAIQSLTLVEILE